jgi:hypothetical protein
MSSEVGQHAAGRIARHADQRSVTCGNQLSLLSVGVPHQKTFEFPRDPDPVGVHGIGLHEHQRVGYTRRRDTAIGTDRQPEEPILAAE